MYGGFLCTFATNPPPQQRLSRHIKKRPLPPFLRIFFFLFSNSSIIDLCSSVPKVLFFFILFHFNIFFLHFFSIKNLFSSSSLFPFPLKFVKGAVLLFRALFLFIYYYHIIFTSILSSPNRLYLLLLSTIIIIIIIPFFFFFWVGNSRWFDLFLLDRLAQEELTFEYEIYCISQDLWSVEKKCTLVVARIFGSAEISLHLHVPFYTNSNGRRGLFSKDFFFEAKKKNQHPP